MNGYEQITYEIQCRNCTIQFKLTIMIANSENSLVCPFCMRSISLLSKLEGGDVYCTNQIANAIAVGSKPSVQLSNSASNVQPADAACPVIMFCVITIGLLLLIFWSWGFFR